MSDELKPCPFCGGEARAFYCEESGTFDVQCQICGAIPFIGSRTSEMKSLDTVIASWNARAERTCHNLYHVGSSLGEGGFRCSLCDAEMESDEPKFCPDCGAKVAG